MAIKKLRTDKTFQQFISELKKKKTGENTAENEFENLPEEAVENSGQEIADTEKRKAETSMKLFPLKIIPERYSHPFPLNDQIMFGSYQF